MFAFVPAALMSIYTLSIVVDRKKKNIFKNYYVLEICTKI